MSISKQKTSLFFKLSISLTVFSALFKFIPSSLLIIGILGMTIFLGIQLFQKDQKEAIDYARFLLIISFAGNYAFSLFSTPYVHILTLITKLALISLMLLYIKKLIPAFQGIMQKNSLLLSSFGREQLSFILAELAIVYIVIASLFTLLHWEIGMLSGNLLLVIGLFFALVSILASSRTLKI